MRTGKLESPPADSVLEVLAPDESRLDAATSVAGVLADSATVAVSGLATGDDVLGVGEATADVVAGVSVEGRDAVLVELPDVAGLLVQLATTIRHIALITARCRFMALHSWFCGRMFGLSWPIFASAVVMVRTA